MDIRQKTVRALETFLSELEVEGVCGFFVDPDHDGQVKVCLLYTSPSPRDRQKSRMPSSA